MAIVIRKSRGRTLRVRRVVSLRYALLAVLTAGPLTGYDAAKRFSSSVGHVWSAPDSQIYPELRRMEREGLLVGEEVRWGPNSTKTQYRITDAGVESFRVWVNTPLGYSPTRDVHRTQAAYFEWASPESARQILLAHAAHHARQVELLTVIRDGIKAGTDPAISRRLESAPQSDRERIIAYKVHMYDGMIAQANMEIDWAREGLDLVNRMNPGRDVDQ